MAKKKCDRENKKPTLSVSQVIRNRRIRADNKNDLIRFFEKLILLVLIIWLMLGFVFGIKIVEDLSMQPRISPKDVILYYRFSPMYDISKVVVIEKDGDSYVSRIVAKPSDLVDITTEGGLRVNGSFVAEPSIFYKTKPYDNDVEYPIKLKEDEYFVLGDFRDGAKDSRVFGIVKESEIRGEVIVVIRKSNL